MQVAVNNRSPDVGRRGASVMMPGRGRKGSRTVPMADTRSVVSLPR